MFHLLFMLLIAAAADSVAPSWPRFRGPNGSGVSNDAGLAAEWNAASGVAWKVELPGAGNSSPVIWGNHAFVQSATREERLLLAFDTASGRLLWSRSMPGTNAPINRKNSLASSTPTTDGERVYALFWDGGALKLDAFDFAGNPVWSRKLGTLDTQHGAGASPFVYRDRVLLLEDQDPHSNLLAFDSRTGKPLWQARRQVFDSGTCYSTPFLLERPGVAPEVVVLTTAGLTGYAPDTGVELWSWTWPFGGKPLRTVSSPIYHDGIIFATAGNGGGDRQVVAVRIEGAGKNTKATLAWELRRTYPYVPSLLARGEHLYFINDLGIAGCAVARTGESVWTERLGGNIVASPILVGGRIYAASEEGDVYVFTASPRFQLLAHNSVGEMVRATPAAAGGRLFIRGQRHLFCIGGAPAVTSGGH